MELKIYNQSGLLKLTVSTSSSSTWNNELMTENAVSASWVYPEYVPLDVNDYVMLEGVKFSIKKEYKPKQKDTQTYSYSVKFYAPIHDAQQVVYLHLTDGQYEPQFSLDGSPREHLQKWVDNMNRIYGAAVWSIGDVVVADNQTIEYNNVTCWDALTSISEAFGTEWWADGFVMNLSRCECGEKVELGYLQGLTSLTQSENSNDVKFFTRLIPLGSTKNIDASRYGFSRLQLPDKEKYVDRNTHYGLYEHVEEAAFAEIFPHYTGTITSVRSEEKTGEDKKPFTVYYFKDDGMTFDPCANEIGVLVKHVSFQTGDLAGRDFEANYNSTTKEWEIVNTYPSDDVQIPGGNLIPAVGNKYIPWNFRMPESYEKQAELDYKAAVDDFLTKYSDDVSKYGGDTDYIYIDKNKVSLSLGQRVRLLSDKYFAASEGYRDTRLTKVVRKLDNLSIANIECTNQVGKGWKSQVDSSLAELKYIVDKQVEQTIFDILKTGDPKLPSEYNVLSGRRTLNEIERRALSSLDDDEAAGIITFLKGLLIGTNGSSFTSLQDGTSQLVVDRLYVKIKAIFDELEVKKKTYVGGEQILSPAGMKCIRVEEQTDAYRCYFKAEEDGIEIENKFTPGTLAISQECNIKVGVSHHAGNRYYWRLVTSVGADYIELSKTECDPNIENDIPVAGDDIVALGHNTDITRQGAIVLSSVNEVAPSILMYQGINDFTLAGKEVLGFDFDKATGKARMRVYGDAYIGAKDESTYIKYTQEKGVDIKGVLHIEKGSTGWRNAEGLPEEIQSAINIANSAKEAADDNASFIEGISSELDSIKNQVDGAIETWFYDPIPSLFNEPASDWITEETKNEHLGDLYYDANGNAYRFQIKEGVYYWKYIEDTAVTEALETAKKAKDTADGKRRVFVVQPTAGSEYDTGDLWVNANYGTVYKNDLLRCKTSKIKGATFDISHWELASKYTDDSKAQEAINIIESLEYGKSNMLRNSGFTGDYLSRQLSSATELTGTSEMYSPSLDHWDVSNVTVRDSSTSQSGKEAVLNGGSMIQVLHYKMMMGESYIFSFKGKGTVLTFACGGYSETVALTSDYRRYIKKFNSTSAGMTFSITAATGTVCELQLERGTVVSAWGPSMMDNTSELAHYQSLQYISDAIKNGSVDILGGLILAAQLQLGNYKDGKMQQVTSGVSGIYNDSDDVAFWAGGTFEQAINAVMTYKDNPDYQPTEAELAQMANAVITHGGRSILNDVVLRGYIYALGGVFKGTVDAADGTTHIDADGTGWMGKILDEYFAKWDSDGNGSLCFGNIDWNNVRKLLTVNGQLNAKGGSKLGNLIINENGAQIGGNAVFEDISFLFSLPPIFIENQDQIAARIQDSIIGQIAKSTTIFLNVNRGQQNFRYTVNLPTRDEIFNKAGVGNSYGFRLTIVVTSSIFKFPGSMFDPINFNPTFRITSRPRQNDSLFGNDFPTGEIHDNDDNRVDYIDMAKGDVLELYYYNGIYYLLNKRS